MWRAWKERPYFQDFLERGKLRLQRVQYYRKIEDADRADADEGEARLKVPGDVPVVMMDKETGKIVGEHTQPGHFNWSMGFHNPTYILCLSQPTVDTEFLKQRFGPHVVHVFSPQRFCERVNTSLLGLQLNERSIASIEWFQVRYDKGLVGPHPDDLLWSVRIAYGQKAPEHGVECEYRCAVVLSGGPVDSPEYLDITLGDISSFARPYAIPVSGAV